RRGKSSITLLVPSKRQGGSPGPPIQYSRQGAQYSQRKRPQLRGNCAEASASLYRFPRSTERCGSRTVFGVSFTHAIKFAIFDGRLVLTGSYNWSTAAEEDNDENAVFIRNPSVIQAFQTNFNLIWSTR